MPLEIVRNDITKMPVDAIVNAANRSLLGGGGVDGAIHRAAGPELLEECRALGGCETGHAKRTRAYRLPAKWVIHTVGPIWRGGGCGEERLLRSCYQSCLRIAVESECETVAFPLISAGAYGYPKEEALRVAMETIRAFLQEHELTVYLVLFGRTEFLAGKQLVRDVQEYIDDVYAREHTRPNVESSRRVLWREDESAALRFDQSLVRPPMAPRSAAPLQEEGFALEKAAAPQGAEPSLEELLRRTDEGFSETLLRLIDEKGMTDAECYKRANVDRKLFSKIRSNSAYRPSKPTVFAFAVALRLDLPETENLLERAGFAISHASKFDIILEYFIKTGNFDIFEINEVLFHYDMPLLGSGVGA